MQRKLAYSAFGWLTLSGALHFIVDVVSQHIRGKRVPGMETTLYYGMHTAYALGQVLFGILGLFIIRHALPLFGQWPMRLVCVLAFSGWTIFCFMFVGYWEPKVNIFIFGALLIVGFAVRSDENNDIKKSQTGLGRG